MADPGYDLTISDLDHTMSLGESLMAVYLAVQAAQAAAASTSPVLAGTR